MGQIDGTDSMHRLRQVKWLTLGVSVFSVTILEVYYYFFQHVSLYAAFTNWALTMALAAALVEITFRGAQEVVKEHDLEIEARRRAQASLEESERRYRQLIEEASDVVYTADLKGNFTYVNAPAEKLTGYSADDLTGTHYSKLVHPDWRERVSEFYAKQLKQQISETLFDFAIVTGSGETKWVEQVVVLQKDGEDPVGVQSTVRDITDRKLAEESERERRAIAEALRDIAAALNSTLNLDEVLDRILANIDSVVRHDAANIMLLEEDLAHIARSKTHNGHDPGVWLSAAKFKAAEHSNLRRMVHTGEPYAIPDTRDAPEWRATPQNKWIGSWAGAPIQNKDEVIGFLNLYSRAPRFYTDEHAQRLQAFADQAAVAIQNARLYEQAQELAALKEREHLARELHDSVTQTLSSASLIADVLPRQLKIAPDKAEQSLDSLRQLTRGALAEMRSLLMELRPSVLVEVELADLLRQLTEALQGRTRASVALDIEGQLPRLPPDVQIGIYRITQEALSNVTKHARAMEVNVTVTSLNQDGLRLCVTDNGIGFNPEVVPAGHLGINIMQERADAIGASLQIQSRVGHGTQIVINWSNQRGRENHVGFQAH